MRRLHRLTLRRSLETPPLVRTVTNKPTYQTSPLNREITNKPTYSGPVTAPLPSKVQPPRGWTPTPYVTETIVQKH